MPISGGQAMAAIDVWDVLVAAITTPGSIGELLDDYRLNFVAYTYGPTSLAAGASFVPPANTIGMIQSLEAVGDTDFQIFQDAANNARVYTSALPNYGMTGCVFYNGTTTIKNNDANARDLRIHGLTLQ